MLTGSVEIEGQRLRICAKKSPSKVDRIIRLFDSDQASCKILHVALGQGSGCESQKQSQHRTDGHMSHDGRSLFKQKAPVYRHTINGGRSVYHKMKRKGIISILRSSKTGAVHWAHQVFNSTVIGKWSEYPSRSAPLLAEGRLNLRGLPLEAFRMSGLNTPTLS